jgi:hypothetical protein
MPCAQQQSSSSSSSRQTPRFRRTISKAPLFFLHHISHHSSPRDAIFVHPPKKTKTRGSFDSVPLSPRVHLPSLISRHDDELLPNPSPLASLVSFPLALFVKARRVTSPPTPRDLCQQEKGVCVCVCVCGCVGKASRF